MLIRSNLSCTFLWFLLCRVSRSSCAWTTHGTRRSIGSRSSVRKASSSSSSEHDDENLEMERKMALVRCIQMSFYKQTNRTGSTLDVSSGMVENLALWRAPWTELPGRSNVLNVHDPIYTNMYEEILYGEKPWYVGHLYLPDGSKNLKTEQEEFRLKTWEEEAANHHHRFEDEDVVVVSGTEKEEPRRSAVVGTLLKIADYRRMADGRLLLLVQALERFVVVNVKRELPYSVADVQLLPDPEEIDHPTSWVEQRTEGSVREARALALAESFQRYHRYEYDENFKLPIPEKENLSITDICASSIAKVLPFVPYSRQVDVSEIEDQPLITLPSEKETLVVDSSSSEEEKQKDRTRPSSVVVDDKNEFCLEHKLVRGKVLKEPKLIAEHYTSLEDLEYRLWLAMNEYLKATKTPVAPALLGLMPPEVSNWPSNFVLKRLAKELTTKDNLHHSYVQVSPHYPAHRRLRRVSFSAAAVLEHKPGMENLRQTLLETSSTTARLALMLQLLEEENSKRWGEFL